MAQDSLGKKTHLPAVSFLFFNADKIWGTGVKVDLLQAIRTASNNRLLGRVFGKHGWPWDPRSQQAYVHRFFGWLSLDPNDQLEYPTRVLSTSDSVAFRQCLWIDFVFGTPEALRAVGGLRRAMQASRLHRFEVSPRTHREFCKWVSIPQQDNTRRGPFARWLEDVGLAIPKPNRGVNETAVVVELSPPGLVTSEAFVYGLLREFRDPISHEGLFPARVTSTQATTSDCVRALMIPEDDVREHLDRAVACGYLTKELNGYVIEPRLFAAALRRRLPFPSQDWVRPERSIDNPLERETLEELLKFPEDSLTTTTGSPFESSHQLSTTLRLARDGAFGPRVAAAYNQRCCISGLRFRSPRRVSWHGQAAHIVPHSGRDRQGNNVYGASMISNGIFLSAFYHWCFDKGWITLKPQTAGSSNVKGYRIHVATVLADDFFEEERQLLLPLDNTIIPVRFLPSNPEIWPSIKALEWHGENVFDG